MAQAEFDFAWDCPLQIALDFMNKHQLTLSSYDSHGPGGGNPCLILSGTREQLIEALYEQYSTGGHTLTGRDDPWLLGHITG